MIGFIYAIESGEAVKLGFAQYPVRRLSELNVGSPGCHRLIGFIEGTRQQEAELHRLCAPAKIRGEWFRKEGAVLTFLASLPPYQPTPKPLPRSTESRARVPLKFEPSPTQRALLDNLTRLSAIYGASKGTSQGVIWREAVGDNRFANRVQTHSFRAATYDRAVGWFSSNWPDNVPWPELHVSGFRCPQCDGEGR